jgi:glycosyltransferase involved in cell wall biosynthesis
MRMMVPTVTVVIPCFNHGAFVRAAVDSALGQVGAEVRVVIVEDGSTDGTTPAACDACVGERVRVIHQENLGLPAARNRGAAGAESQFLVFLDADDWIEPEFVRKLAMAMADAGPEVSHAFCQEKLVDKGTGVWKVPEWDPVLLLLTNIHPVTTLLKRERFEAVGGFDETMRGGYEDWEFWLRVLERGWRGVRVREPLFVWRRHSHSTMVMNIIRNHAALFAAIRSKHQALYREHAEELIVRSNGLMRRCEMNWLDEQGEPIKLRAMKQQRRMYEAILAVRVQRRIQRMLGVAGGKSR